MASDLAELQSKKDRILAIGKEIAHQRSEFEKSISELVRQQEKLRDEYAAALRAELASIGGSASNGVTSRTRAPKGSNKIDPATIVAVLEAAQVEISAADIKERAGITASSNSLSIALKKMVDDGQIIRVGERRASKYRIR